MLRDKLLNILVLAFFCVSLSNCTFKKSMNMKLGSNDGLSNDTAPLPSTEVINLSLTAASRTMDRKSVGAILNRAFGPSASATISTNIIDKADLFGGSVDPYDSVWTYDPNATTTSGGVTTVTPKISLKGGDVVNCGASAVAYDYGKIDLALCWETENMNAPMVFPSTSLRQGRMRIACETIAKDTAAIQYFMNQMSGANPDSDAGVQLAYNLFYSSRSLASVTAIADLRKSAVVGATAKVGGSTVANLEAWRILALNLCMAPGWQIF